MKKSIPLSVTVAEPSPAPDFSFLFAGRRTWVMGVLNATPDSFYAASRAVQVESAIHLAEDMIDHGADLLDIGGESTRPGAASVPAGAELERVIPIIEAVQERWPDHLLSIDTQKADVARQALSRGVKLVNDISALRGDPEMAGVVAEAGCPVVLMHMQGTPESMQQEPHYEDVIDEIKRFFAERLEFAARRGIDEARVILDPGIGFGKTLEHNLTILRRLGEFSTFGRPLLLGLSRKSFIGKLLGNGPSPGPWPASPQGEATSKESPLPGERAGEARGEGPLAPEDRLEGSLAAALWAVEQGASGLRAHDVGATRRALRVWEAVRPA